MGTRGCYGFRKNGQDKLTYNHWDSYPDWLGEVMLRFCKDTSIEEMNEIFDGIILVDKSSEATMEQVEECRKYYDRSVDNGSINNWYCLLRGAQGYPNAYKEGLRYMIDNHDFIKDSLFCEYAYIINLDTNYLEFWIGFQKKPNSNHRYGTEMEVNGYYPCNIIACYSLDDISSGKYSIQECIDNMNNLASEN